MEGQKTLRIALQRIVIGFEAILKIIWQFEVNLKIT